MTCADKQTFNPGHVIWPGWRWRQGKPLETQLNTNTQCWVKIQAGRQKQADFFSSPKKNTCIKPQWPALCCSLYIIPTIKTIMSAEECTRRFGAIRPTGNDPYVGHMGCLTNRFMSWGQPNKCVLQSGPVCVYMCHFKKMGLWMCMELSLPAKMKKAITSALHQFVQMFL